MNEQIKQKWVNALRSGEYEQCESNLHKNKGFCCLGVLTDIYIQEHPGCSWKEYGATLRNKELYYAFVGTKTTEYNEEEYLPVEVVEWADLASENPCVYIDGIWTNLSDVNDSGWTFEAIANLIENKL